MAIDTQSAWRRWTRALLGLLLPLALATPAWAADELISIDWQGQARTAQVHWPDRPAADDRPLPLVLMLHGGGGSAQGAARETGWADKADREGFVVALPNALARDPSRRSSFATNPQLWNDGSDRFHPGHSGTDDVGFIAALIDHLALRRAIDADRVFVTGFSNGGSMSFKLGAELATRVAAIAPVAGALWFEPGTLARPVPMLYLTGDADPLNPIEGGVPRLAWGGGGDTLRAKAKPPVRQSVQTWAAAVGCRSAFISAESPDGVRTETCPGKPDGAEVVFVTVAGLGHTWAGGLSLLPAWLVGPTVERPRATDLIWAFFERHPRRHPKAPTSQGR